MATAEWITNYADDFHAAIEPIVESLPRSYLAADSFEDLMRGYLAMHEEAMAAAASVATAIGNDNTSIYIYMYDLCLCVYILIRFQVQRPPPAPQGVGHPRWRRGNGPFVAFHPKAGLHVHMLTYASICLHVLSYVCKVYAYVYICLHVHAPACRGI